MKVNIAVCDPDVKSFLRPLLEIPDGEMVQSGRTPEFLARARRPAVVEPRPAVPGLAKPAVGRNWARVDLIYSWAADQKPDIRLLALGNV